MKTDVKRVALQRLFGGLRVMTMLVVGADGAVRLRVVDVSQGGSGWSGRSGRSR